MSLRFLERDDKIMHPRKKKTVFYEAIGKKIKGTNIMI